MGQLHIVLLYLLSTVAAYGDQKEEKLLEQLVYEIASLRQEVNSVNTRLDATEKYFHDQFLEQDITMSEQVKLNHRLNQRLEKRVSELEEKEKQRSTHAGFTAYATFNSKTYNDGDKLDFQTEAYDGNNAYNADTSTYTCPASGVYLFIVSVTGHGSSGGEYTFDFGGVEQNGGHVTAVSGGDASYASVVLTCLQGTQVYVKVKTNGFKPMASTNGVVASSFTGCLLELDV